MASPPLANVHLEIVEETADEGQEPHPMRHRQMAGLPMGQHEQGFFPLVRRFAESWRIAGSWILSRAIGDEALRKAGYSWIGCYYSASALPKG